LSFIHSLNYYNHHKLAPFHATIHHRFISYFLIKGDCMNATHTQLIATQKLGDHWSQLNQISLYERNLRSTQLIDAQMLIDW